MKHLFYLLTVASMALIFTSCGGEKKESLPDPQINAKIGVELGHIEDVAAIALKPGTNQVAVSSFDKRLVLWDYNTKHELWAYSPKQNESAGDLREVFYTLDGKKIVARAVGYVAIFDAENGNVLKNIKVGGSFGDCLALSPDNKFVAVDAKDYAVSIIDINSGEEVKKLTGHTRKINDLTFSADGKYIGSASGDSSVIIWEFETGKQVKKIKAKEEVRAIAISTENNKFAFSVPDLKELHIWDLKKMESLKTVNDLSVVKIILNGENLILKEYYALKELSLKDYSIIKNIEDYGYHISSLVDNKLATSGGRKGFRIYDFTTGKVMTEFGHNTRFIQDIKVNETGRFIVVSYGKPAPDLLSFPIDTNYNFSFYDISGGQVGAFAFAEDKDVIFYEERLGYAYYSNLKTAKTISNIKNKVTDPFHITSDGKLLIARDPDNSGFGIYDAKIGDLKTKLVSTKESVNFSAITPDDKYYILANRDFCKVFELPSGKEVKSYKNEDMYGLLFVDINKDGKYVVGKSGLNFELVDILTGEVLFMLEETMANDAVMYKDKNTVAIACKDWTIKILDLSNKAVTKTLAHDEIVESVEYTPDGKYLISSAQDGKMNIWDLDGKLLLTVVAVREEYAKEVKDFVVFAPNGRYDGTEAGIERMLYFEENGQRKPAKDFKDKCYTPNLLGKTLGQNFQKKN